MIQNYNMNAKPENPLSKSKVW